MITALMFLSGWTPLQMAAGAGGLVGASFPPLMRLARADHLLPRWVRALPTTLVGLLLLLTIEVSS
ncbi:hypothetical protein [Streptomyces bauhiniae]|uniref:Uncharacterized protein n=1 Tax=Streptomyces bauhiniae TaxID=2340725 RepID=A0A7K3QR69_9ACTN|nr:hypothetical protein [Streptomyces bauhiniae]NEB92386.1 hypothetical protein [Streptomyces bauhiniae]